MKNCERITLSSGDYINLSDIPNKQVFNLVKDCFINAGFNDCNGKYAQWENRDNYKVITIGANDDLIEFSQAEERQLSLSDIFNSVNGMFDWQGSDYIHLLSSGKLVYGHKEFCIDGSGQVNTIKRIPEAPEAIISTKTSQWWDYDKGRAVGLPEKGELVLYEDKQYEVIRATVNDTNDKVVLLCLYVDRPNTKSDVFWMNITDIKPLDYKTSKQIILDKALDLAAQNMSFEMFVERLYYAGLLKGGE